MEEIISRRNFLTHGTGVVLTLANTPVLASQDNASSQMDFPVADLHVHVSGRLSIEQAMQVAKERRVKFGIVEHPGHNYKIKTDQDLKRYLGMLAPHPVYKGIQPVYPKWREAFSKELLARVEYVLMDAQTLPNPDGTFWRIWRSDTVVTDKEKFMDRYVDYFIQILTTESLNILAAPFYLPRCIAQGYKTLWTPKRVQTIIDLAVKHRVAIEISESFRVPDAALVKLAKAAGAKFTFGTNSRHPQTAGRLDYCRKIARQCGLSKKDMYLPTHPRDKKQVSPRKTLS
jgi:histidinol phosphatase-like PHP family hydrolase